MLTKRQALWASPIFLIAISVVTCSGVNGCGGGRRGPEVEALQRGAALVDQGKYPEAIVELTNAIQLNPASARAYYNRGRAYAHIGQTHQAIADYTKAIELMDPEIIQSAYNNRGQVYEKLGDLDHALDDYTKGIDTMPHPKFSGFRRFQAQLRRNRVEIYVSRQAYDKAWEDIHGIEQLGYEVEPEFVEQLKQASGRER